MDSRLRGSDTAAHGHSRAGGNPSSGVLESLPELLKQLLRSAMESLHRAKATLLKLLGIKAHLYKYKFYVARRVASASPGARTKSLLILNPCSCAKSKRVTGSRATQASSPGGSRRSGGGSRARGRSDPPPGSPRRRSSNHRHDRRGPSPSPKPMRSRL